MFWVAPATLVLVFITFCLAAARAATTGVAFAPDERVAVVRTALRAATAGVAAGALLRLTAAYRCGFA